ncbi:WD repeat-containing protein 6-like isoform X1 [Branchiostoma floridae]|uniref:tRNA (34-2'-O)-methyltransferase regulator WDR6 n=2 Tax=Branchiostoma floridae TaxID=7739 RepID=A0A9J7KYL9_BRAFL|nr:WD repeat-containing protein 6-like isoform X1 [Branchiostoma floridae]
MMKTEYITAPVTALAFAGNLLLAGEGPCLHLYDVTSTKHLLEQHVLKHANIHGIRTAVGRLGADCWDVALFGQKSLQLVQIRCTESAIKREDVLVTPVNQLGDCEVHDWIWDVCWLLPRQTKGQDMRQLALALGHNTVVLWDAEAQRSIREVHCQEKCILYCAHFIGTSWSDLVLAAGTVFREVVLWKPCDQKEHQDCVSVLQRISGHQGVIFSVCYHPPTGRLCTASDDRSVRLWQVAGLQQGLDTGTAVGLPTAWQFELVFEVYGHGSRVWDVQLTQDYVISVGEDAQCIVWNMRGEIIKTFRGHKGNSIWSLAVSEQQGLVATGGGDTSTRLWELPGSGLCQTEVVGTSSTLDLPLSLGDFPRSLVSCLDHLFLVVTDQGSLFSYNTTTCQWRLVLQDPTYSSYSLLEVSAQGMVAMGSLAGTIKVFFISAPNACWETEVYDGKVLSLTWMETLKAETVSSLGHLLSCGPKGEVIWWTTQTGEEAGIAVQKTATFELPYSRQRWLTCALLSQKDSTLVCGDRRGSLHCYRKQEGDEPTQPFQTLIGIHGKTGVTSLQMYRSHVYSTGRDGHYRQFQLGATGLQLLKNNRVYKGFDWLEKLTFTKDGEVLALGFHTSNFVVWSLSANEPLLQVQCGGGHRAWGILPSTRQGALFAYIKARAIQLMKRPSISSNKRLILKDSLHGREITCLKFLGWASNNEGAQHAICATSSEDTTINIVALKHKPVSDLVVLDTIQDHISSVRCLAVCSQHATSGASQHASSPKLLFSGGGRAQLKCYRVSVSSHGDSSGGVDKVKPCYEEDGSKHQNSKTNTQQDGHPPKVSVKETCEPQGYESVNSLLDTSAGESGPGNNRTLQQESTDHSCDVPDTELTTFDGHPAVECHIEYLACHNLVERRRRKKKSGAAQIEEEEEVEIRYMALTAWQGGQVDPHAAHLFFLAAACSDGFLRLFVYDDRQRKIELFCVSDFHHHCVLSVDHFFTTTADGSTHTYVISGATDGQIAVWNVTPVLLASLSSDDITAQETRNVSLGASAEVAQPLTTEATKHQGGMDPSTKDMQAAAAPVLKMQVDSGCLRKTGASKVKMNSPDVLLESHQSGVNAISIWRVDSHHYLVASGGDDNSLQITLLSLQKDTPNKPVIVATATSSAHAAHAATITDVHIVDSCTILTASVDQRVNMWMYQLILKPTAQCHLSFLHGEFCHIADIAGLECWNDGCGEQYMAVCGHGIQLLSSAPLSS